MRIATWNVNSLPARLEKVRWWLDRAKPDVLLMQETKIADADAPHDAFRDAGYALAHHGEGRWNGVAVASRVGLDSVVYGFGDPTDAEARMIAATCGGVRVVGVYAPNGRSLDSPQFPLKLAWFARLERWLREHGDPGVPTVVAGDMNLAPDDRDVWDPVAVNGGTHVSPPERAAFARLCDWGLVDAWRSLHAEGDRYSWWDYRAGMFHKNYGMRIDLLLVTRPVAARLAGAEIDREARKGKPTPSDHAPVWIDVDTPGIAVDTGWAGADERIAARRR